jgi:hypothetical protein
MTLNTKIFILDQADHAEVFHFCRSLMDCTDAHKFGDSGGCISNHPMQGLPAWLMVYYRPGEMLLTPAQAAEHDEDICNVPTSEWFDAEQGECTGEGHDPAHWLAVSFDTACGYSDQRGYGCGDLHAEYVAKLGQWLDTKGIRWAWENEFTGEIHTGYERLIDLSSGGFEASAWFRTTVLPAIAAELNAADPA